MKNIFIVNDEHNHGSKWEVIIGTDIHHCRDDDEVIDLIRQALFQKNEENLVLRAQDLKIQDEDIFAQEGDWGD